MVVLSSALSLFDASDLILLSLSVSTNLSPEIVSENPIFFPQFSPNLAYRLIVYKLASTVFLTFLAGADFVMDNSTQARIDSFWREELDTVKRMMDLPPKWLPSAVEQQLPQSLLGMLLWNTESKRFFVSPVWPAVTEERSRERHKQLIQFFRIVRLLLNSSVENMGPPIRDVYRQFDERKFYFIHRQKYQLFTMFDSGEPQHSLRHVCEIVLALCTKRQAAQPL